MQKSLFACLLASLLLWSSIAWAVCDQTTLHNEFVNDPAQRGYAACGTDNDTCVLVAFNGVCTLDPLCKLPRILTRSELYAAINRNELQTLLSNATQKDLLMAALQVDTFDLGDNNLVTKLSDIFPSAVAPITRNTLQSIKIKDSSRAQVLCGRIGTLSDVSLGLRGVP